VFISCRGDGHHGEPSGHPPKSASNSHGRWWAIRLPICKVHSLSQRAHVIGIWLITQVLQLVAEWVWNRAIDIDKLVLIAEIGCLDLEIFNFVHFFHLVIQLIKFFGVKGEGRARTLSNLSNKLVNFSFASSLFDKLNDFTLRLKHFSNLKEAFDIVGSD